MLNNQSINQLNSFLLGTQALLKKDYENAIKHYKSASNNGNESNELKNNRAIAYFEYGNKLLKEQIDRSKIDYPKAIKQFDEAIKFGYPGGSAHYNKGVAYLYDKKYNEAISSFQGAINQGYKEAQCYYNLGIAYNELDKLDDAIKNFKEAKIQKPNDEDILYEYGSAQLQGTYYTDSINTFKTLLESPELSDLRKIDILCKLTKSTKEVIKNLPITENANVDQNNSFIPYLQTAKDLLNNIQSAPNYKEYAIYIYSNLGTIELTNGQLEQAKEHLEKANKLDTKDRVVANNLSITLAQLAKQLDDVSDEDSAIQKQEYYGNAIDLLKNFNDPSSLQNLASIYLSADQPDDASKVFSQLLGEQDNALSTL
jgi:tetratricopeptide (TPR) repeat protein